MIAPNDCNAPYINSKILLDFILLKPFVKNFPCMIMTARVGFGEVIP